MIKIISRFLVNDNAKGNVGILAQLLLVWVAFMVMSVLSLFFVGDLVHRYLEKEKNTTLNFIEEQITSDLAETENLMIGIAGTIRRMIFWGVSSDIIDEYMLGMSNGVFKKEKRRLNYTGLYGYFDVFDGLYINDKEWEPPEDYIPTERPWYKTAVEAGGKIVFTEPYLDMRSGSYVTTCTTHLLDDDGRSLGVINIDIPMEILAHDLVNINLTEGSYGLLLNKRLEVIAHPFNRNIGRQLREWNSGLADLADELQKKGEINDRRVYNYRGEESIVFFRHLANNWCIGIVTPYKHYYKDVRNMQVVIIILAVTFASILSIMFLSIASAKSRSDIKNRQKSYFLATMSHEIRTPLNAILGMTEIQLQEESISQSVRDAFYNISNSGNLLLGIINDILDLSKIEAGKMEIVPEEYDVPNLINDSVQLNLLRFDSKQITFKLKVDESLPQKLMGDELRIKQILNNLLSNAFKYTDAGEVCLDVRADYVMRGGAALVTLVFVISDTGQGMTAQQIKQLGEDYSRFNMSANRTTEGTGLGMSIARNLVHLMYGSLLIESKLGKGTKITVKLPQKNIGYNVIGKEVAKTLQQLRLTKLSQLEKAQINREPMPYGRVLIVDDVESNLYVAKGLMVPYELSIDIASNGYEAIEKIKNGNTYDIIFMDHMMPKMDGIETTRIIRNMGYTHPIIALTANALLGQAEMFLENGFDGFISKPIDIRQLNASLNKFIRDKQPQEVIEAAWKRKSAQPTAENLQQVIDRQLAKIFKRDANKVIAALEAISDKPDTFKDDTLHEYIINVHAIKSALANIGEHDASSIASMLEKAGRKKNIAIIKKETPDFIVMLRTIVKKIQPKEEEESSNGEMKPKDKAELKEKLEIIRQACLNYDKKTAKSTLSELRQKQWPIKIKELINAITEHLLHSDFEESAAIIENYVILNIGE